MTENLWARDGVFNFYAELQYFEQKIPINIYGLSWMILLPQVIRIFEDGRVYDAFISNG